MSFRARVLVISSLLALLVAAFLLGTFLSPEQAQEGAAQEPLLAAAGPGDISEVDFVYQGSVELTLRRKDGGWEALTAGHVHPGSTDRIEAFVKGVTGLKRGRLVGTGRGGQLAELGLSDDTARLLVLRGGKGETGLLIGKRGPSGDEDYMMVKGTDAVHLVRGSLAFTLSQDRAYWYELHILPDEVRGAEISRISVTGRLKLSDSEERVLQGPYALVRGTGQQEAEWTLSGDRRKVNQLVASGMANSLALLEGADFAEQTAAGEAGGASGLRVEVSTVHGRTFSFLVRSGLRAGQYLATTSWSTWIYMLDELPLKRAIPSVFDLLQQ